MMLSKRRLMRAMGFALLASAVAQPALALSPDAIRTQLTQLIKARQIHSPAGTVADAAAIDPLVGLLQNDPAVQSASALTPQMVLNAASAAAKQQGSKSAGSSTSPSGAANSGTGNQSADPTQMAETFSKLLEAIPSINLSTSSLVSLPLPAYTVEVTTSSGLALDFPAVFGEPALIPVACAWIAVGLPCTQGDVLRVQLKQTQPGAHYLLQIDRQLPNSAALFPLPLKIEAVVKLSNPLNPLANAATLRVGYDARTNQDGAAGSIPAWFFVEYDSDSGTHQLTASAWEPRHPGKYSIIASYNDPFTPQSIDAYVDSWTDTWFTFTKESSPPNQYTWVSGIQPNSGTSMGIDGTNGSSPFNIELYNLPNKMVLCSDHKGGACNEPWLSGDNSFKSFRFAANDYYGNPVPVTTYVDYHNLSSDGTTDNHTYIFNLQLSHFAVAEHFSLGWSDVNPFPIGNEGDWPKWLYVNTADVQAPNRSPQPVSGYVLNEQLNNGARGHYFEVNAPAPGFNADGRRVSVDKSWDWFTLSWDYNVSTSGSMSCPGGFKIRTDSIPGWLIDLFTGIYLCS